MFDFAVGQHVDRLGNMYFDYMLLYRAITKLGGLLKTIKFNSDDLKEEKFIQKSIKNITLISPDCPKNFDRVLFGSNSNPAIIDEMKRRFRNITGIMDCVSCERCRLWGKVQTLGIGTALKVLFASEDKHQWKNLNLKRCEIVALFNAFGRFSESISAVQRFREEFKERRHRRENFKIFFLSASNIFLIVAIFSSSFLIYHGLGKRRRARKLVEARAAEKLTTND